MKINVLGIVKGVSEMAVSAGAGAVVGNLVRATTPIDLNKFQRIIVGIGGYAVGAVLGDLSAKYISSQIDEYATRVSDIMHPSEEMEDAAEDAVEKIVAAADATVNLVQKGTGKKVAVDKSELEGNADDEETE